MRSHLVNYESAKITSRGNTSWRYDPQRSSEAYECEASHLHILVTVISFAKHRAVFFQFGLAALFRPLPEHQKQCWLCLSARHIYFFCPVRAGAPTLSLGDGGEGRKGEADWSDHRLSDSTSQQKLQNYVAFNRISLFRTFSDFSDGPFFPNNNYLFSLRRNSK